jgi:zinc transport system ATP-binding protein
MPRAHGQSCPEQRVWPRTRARQTRKGKGDDVEDLLIPKPTHFCTCQPGATGQPLLSCRQLVVGYHGQPLLPPIDLCLNRGELWAVTGRNGAGKTTWFRTLLGLLPPVSGEVKVCDATLALGYIPQRTHLDSIMPLRAWDVVAMGVERGRSYLRPFYSRDERRRVESVIEELGAQELAPRLFAQLSEGQKQRVLIARLLASHPDLAVLDEPTAAMDEVAERETLELIDRLRKNHGLAILLVSHHLPVVSHFADRVVFLDRDSRSVVAGTPQSVFAHPAFKARYEHASVVHQENHATP